MDSFIAGAALHESTPPGHIFSPHGTGKDEAKIRTNVAAHQEKEKNEKMGKRKAREERRQATDYKEAACCPFVVFQGEARRENGL